MAKVYSEKLKDPRWQKKRLEILQRDNWTCRNCGETEKTLHVHHFKYHGEPWEVNNNFLTTLCEYCHDSFPGSWDDNISDLETMFMQYGWNPRDINKLCGILIEGNGNLKELLTLLWVTVKDEVEFEKAKQKSLELFFNNG